MAIYHIDPINGDDTRTNPLGWWSVAYTGGTGPAPSADELVTGATSGKTANLTVVVAPTSGSWASNNAAGTMYFYGKSGAFVAEQVDFAGGGHMHIAADLAYASWKTGTAGATAARTTPGDIFHIHKSADPELIGDCTWTDNTNTVIIPSGICETVDACDTGWTNDNGTALHQGYSSETGTLQGSACLKVTVDATPAANERQVWKNIADLDLSSYQYLNCWLTNGGTGTVAIAAGNYKICFYSDDLGTTIVDTFEIPAFTSGIVGPYPLKLARVGGGNLSATVKAIGVHVGATPPAGGAIIKLDAMFASQTDGLDLSCVVSKESSAINGTNEWYSIASVMGTTLQLRGYSRIDLWNKYGTDGTTPETVATYFRYAHPIYADGSGTSDYTVQESGTNVNHYLYSGGWDSATNTQNGESFFTVNYLNTRNNPSAGFNFNSKAFIDLEHCHFFDCPSSAILGGNQGYNCTVSHVGIGGSSTWGMTWASSNSTIQLDYLTYCGYGITVNGNNITIRVGRNIAGEYSLFTTASSSTLIDSTLRCDFSARSTSPLNLAGCVNCTVEYVKSRNCTSTSLISLGNGAKSNYIKKADFDNTFICSTFGNYRMDSQIAIGEIVGGNPTIAFEGGTIVKQAATAGGTGNEWLFTCSNVRDSGWPISMIIAHVLCNADVDTTITAYIKKYHATNVHTRLRYKGGQVTGEDDDITTESPDDTTRNAVSITVHPTATEVVEVWADVWVTGASVQTVIIDGTVTIAE